jgi:Protein of unknown function (DUF2865)
VLHCPPFAYRFKLAMVSFVCAATIMPVAKPAQAGFLDFLFGDSAGSSESRSNIPADSHAGVNADAVPVAPDHVQAPRIAGNRQVLFCVRLCDGRYFPIDHISNATPLVTCKAMCPASETKVFFGSEIDHASANDGTRYTDLGAAFVYHQHLIRSCTCNGKDPLGLARVETSSDPTLRPGDIVATETGLKVYAGKHGESLTFAPSEATAAAQINSATSASRVPRHLMASNIAAH